MTNSTTLSAHSPETLGQRLHRTLKVAGLSPRNLGGATLIHFVTIYRIINDENNGIFPTHEHTLRTALDRIDVLLERGLLPFAGKLSGKEKTDALRVMLDQK